MAASGGVRCDAAEDRGPRRRVLHRRGRPARPAAGRCSSAHPWQWPGDVAEPSEHPWETAVRECREETGLRVEGPPKLPATVGRVFHGGRLTPGQLAGIVLDPDEHDEARALAVPEWQGLMPGRDHARPEAVMAARKTGIPTYFGAWDREV